jgi:hypothetical protein
LLLTLLFPCAAAVTNEPSAAGSTGVFVLVVTTAVVSNSATKPNPFETIVTLASLFCQHRFALITFFTIHEILQWTKNVNQPPPERRLEHDCRNHTHVQSAGQIIFSSLPASLPAK